MIGLDATIVIRHSEKQNATPTWKKTFGHQALPYLLDKTGEALEGTLRPPLRRLSPAARYLSNMPPLEHVEPGTSRPDAPAWDMLLREVVAHDDDEWAELGYARGAAPMLSAALRERIANLDVGDLGEAALSVGELLRDHVWQDPGDRIAVALILVRLSPVHVHEAAAVLRSVADSDSLGYARIHAFEALAGLGAPFVAEAKGALLSMISDHATKPQVREFAARAVAEFGPRSLGQAVDALREVLAGTQLGPSARILAVMALAALDQEHHADVVKMFETVAEAPGTRPWELVEPLSALGRALPRYAALSNKMQRAALAHPATSPMQRLMTSRYYGVHPAGELHAEVAEVDEILRTVLLPCDTQTIF